MNTPARYTSKALIFESDIRLNNNKRKLFKLFESDACKYRENPLRSKRSGLKKKYRMAALGGPGVAQGKEQGDFSPGQRFNSSRPDFCKDNPLFVMNLTILIVNPKIKTWR
jgi:hypothetical protein